MSQVDLPRLLRRVAECPAPFLGPVSHRRQDGVQVDAVVYDLLAERPGGPLPPAAEFGADGDRAHLELTLVACWLLADAVFADVPAERQLDCLLALRELAQVLSPQRAVADEDRREELVRSCLDACGLRPDGESAEQAADRLALLDSCERKGLMRALRDKLARARELRRKMAEQRAQEAAARAGREW